MGDVIIWASHNPDTCLKHESKVSGTPYEFVYASEWRTEKARADKLEALLNTPELKDFIKAVPLEAVHQRERWGVEHDAGKEPEDWFWLLGYLAGKALAAVKAGDKEKALHHTISSAAALANWHAAILGKNNEMRPGIAKEKADGERKN